MHTRENNNLQLQLLKRHKNDTVNLLIAYFVILILCDDVENNCISWSWDPCNWWIQCNVWKKAIFDWLGEYRDQQTGVQATFVDHSWSRRIHFWCHPFWGNTVPVDHRWEEICGLLAWCENCSWNQSWQGVILIECTNFFYWCFMWFCVKSAMCSPGSQFSTFLGFRAWFPYQDQTMSLGAKV